MVYWWSLVYWTGIYSWDTKTWNKLLLIIKIIYGKFKSGCGIQDIHKAYINDIWPYIDICFTPLVPFAIIIISNVAIVYRLLWSSYRRRHLHINTDVKMTSMTAILITVSIMFLVTTAPYHIYTTPSVYPDKETDEYQNRTVDLVLAILNMILYTNYAVNFLLYCVSGPRFQKELNAMFCWKTRIIPIQARSTLNTVRTSTAL